MAGNGREKRTVLLVEDQVLWRTLLGIELEEAGYRVLIAASTAEALVVLDHAGARVELIIVDIQISSADDSVQLAQLLRDRYPLVSILVVTSAPPESIPVGVNGYFRKPAFTSDIVAAVQRLMSERSSEPPTEPYAGSA
jgi:CheY-like chemotaxis protein